MIKVISDSTCDLSQELLERYDISILPLHIVLGDDEYEDGFGITPDEIFAWSDAHKTTPKTSAPSVEHAVELFKPILDAGDEIVCFSISEDMSTSATVMRMAAQELNATDRVTVINSQNLSTGIGLLVVEAAIMAKEGRTREEISARIDELIPKVRASFVVDTLVYLYRGGRCSGLEALAGSLLSLHPRIGVADGKMSPGKKYRGKINNVIMSYAKDMEEDILKAYDDRVFITHSGCDRKAVEAVREYLSELNYFKEIHETRAGGVVSSHCGPGTLGVLFILK